MELQQYAAARLQAERVELQRAAENGCLAMLRTLEQAEVRQEADRCAAWLQTEEDRARMVKAFQGDVKRQEDDRASMR